VIAGRRFNITVGYMEAVHDETADKVPGARGDSDICAMIVLSRRLSATEWRSDVCNRIVVCPTLPAALTRSSYGFTSQLTAATPPRRLWVTRRIYSSLK